MSFSLPAPLGDYFSAANDGDANRVAACFAEDARVHDEGQSMEGRDAVRAWAEDSRKKYDFTAQVTGVDAQADAVVVTAHLTGNFPGAPADLRYRFTMIDQLIATLEISG